MLFLKVVWTFIKSVITFVMENWKYFLVGVICLFLAYQFQQFRINNLKADLREVRAEVSSLKEANETNQETIGNLKADVTKTNAICAKRLISKDALIRELQRIDSINNQGGNNAIGSNSDPLIREFNSLFTSSSAD